MFKSLLDLTTNVFSVALAPVEIAADVANGLVVKPTKELLDEIKADERELAEDDNAPQ